MDALRVDNEQKSNKRFDATRIRSRVKRSVRPSNASSLPAVCQPIASVEGRTLNDSFWRRHANPWSAWTRFAAIPAMILAVWSRVWLGWWALVPVAVVVVWLVINSVAFRPVDEPTAWVSKAVYGQQIWLTQRERVPAVYRIIMSWLVVV